MQYAYVYILAHTSGTTVKVGETTHRADVRLRNYSKVYDLQGFHMHREYKVPTEARKEVERQAHATLSKYRLSGLEGARELFSCSPDIAEAAIESAIRQSEVVQRAREERKRRNKEKKERERQAELEKKRLERLQRELAEQQVIERNQAIERIQQSNDHKKYQEISTKITDVQREREKINQEETWLRNPRPTFSLALFFIVFSVGCVAYAHFVYDTPLHELPILLASLVIGIILFFLVSKGNPLRMLFPTPYLKRMERKLMIVEIEMDALEEQREKLIQKYAEPITTDKRL